MRQANLLHSWGKILRGRIPLLSIEVTRECPLSCPGCYAYGDTHLPGGKLKDLTDLRGQDLADAILQLVDRHEPVHVSIVGGEPLMRHRELSAVLPALSHRGVFTMVVTSAVIPIPAAWPDLPRLTVAVSVDGLPREHDARRKPATYERILRNIEGRKVNIHCTVVRAQTEDPAYLESFLEFWSARPEIDRIWFSVYTPQAGERSPEMLTPENRRALVDNLARLRPRFPKLLLPEGMAQAFLHPPASPAECLFSKMSVNYTADLHTRVEPCVFGGTPDCSQCGCSISAALHWIGGVKLLGPLQVRHVARASMAAGSLWNRILPHREALARWEGVPLAAHPVENLVQIEPETRASEEKPC